MACLTYAFYGLHAIDKSISNRYILDKKYAKKDNSKMRLAAIPADKYDDYSLDVIFNAYKWDPQFSDSSTIAKHVLIISEAEHAELVSLTEKLHKETIEAEQLLNANQKLSKALEMPRKIRRHLPRMSSYHEDMHIRLMRFDFHPVAGEKWAISEVNSDVPGGFAEAAILPKVAAKLLDNKIIVISTMGKY